MDRPIDVSSRFTMTRDRQTAPAERRDRWNLLVPWLVLPVALAIITLIDWFRRRRGDAHRAGETRGG